MFSALQIFLVMRYINLLFTFTYFTLTMYYYKITKKQNKNS